MISIVIPNYNGTEMLQKNVVRILEMLRKIKIEHELIVVDDASTDDSVAILNEIKAQDSSASLRTILREKNGGFPIAADQGIRATKGETVFVIKNDCVPENYDYFKLILKHFDNPVVAAVSSALKTQEKGEEEIRGCGQIYFEKGLFKHRRGSNESQISAWSDGGASTFKRSLYLKVGGFDAAYRPGYWEDVDLGYRFWKAGYTVEFEPKAVLVHDFDAGVYKKKYGAEKVKLINLRNQFIFTLKNGDLSSVLKFFLWETYNHLASVKSGEKNFIKAYWMAMWRMPEIIKSRIFQRGNNKLSDEEALGKFTII